MYKLLSLTATNFIGFRSGLSKKTVKIDLSEVCDKNMIIILGDNGVGKSTFTSLIPPLHEPYGTNKSFIVEGKEGLLIREYVNNEGKVLVTKCVYIPKKDKGHTTKAYVGYISEKDGFIPLNPDGNIGSYLDIIEREFKISKAALQLTYYDDNIKDLVKMTHSERVNNINKFVTVNKRYNTAYNVINDKFKASRSIMKNIIQKLSNLRDEKRLDRTLEEYEELISKESKRYEKLVEDISKNNALIEHKLDGKTLLDFSKEYEDIANKISSVQRDMKALKIDKNNNLIDMNNNLNGLNSKIIKLEEGLKHSKLEMLQNSLYDMENELMNYSVDISSEDDEEDLDVSLRQIDSALSELKYSENPKFYDTVSKEEVYLLIDLVNDISDRFDVGIQLHGMKFYKDIDKSEKVYEESIKRIEILEEGLENLKNDLDSAIDELRILENKKEDVKVLESRPKLCVIDDCQFISRALKAEKELARYEEVFSRVEKYKKDLATLNRSFDEFYDIRDMADKQSQILKSLIKHESLLNKYSNKSVADFIEFFNSHEDIDTLIDPIYLDNLKNIVSERETYNNLVNVVRPSIINKIAARKKDDKYSRMISARVEDLNKKIKEVSREVALEQLKVKENKELLDEKIIERNELNDEIERRMQYEMLENELLPYIEKLSKYDKLEVEISAMEKEIKYLLLEKDELDKNLARLFKDRDIVKFEVSEVKKLKIELSEIEIDFKILEILKLITQPGTGIIKDTIDIFMRDIQETANVLISKAFNGKLMLRKFIITDDAFDIPFVFNGMPGSDISNASSSQRWIVSSCISLAILSKILNEYGIVIYDEPDKTLSPQNREEFIKIISEYTRYIGLNQSYIITHSPEFYEGYDAGFILFPGFRLTDYKSTEYVEVN